MRSLHTIEIPFVFDNIAIAGPLISRMPEAHALAARTSAAWTAFARPAPSEAQTWALSVTRDRVVWQRTDTVVPDAHEFLTATWQTR